MRKLCCHLFPSFFVLYFFIYLSLHIYTYIIALCLLNATGRSTSITVLFCCCFASIRTAEEGSEGDSSGFYRPSNTISNGRGNNKKIISSSIDGVATSTPLAFFFFAWTTATTILYCFSPLFFRLLSLYRSKYVFVSEQQKKSKCFT